MNHFGLTFDEKTFERDLSGYLEILLQEGWNCFEFAPDADLLPANTYKQLISKLSASNGQPSFHVPNFIQGKEFNPAAFSTSIQLIDNFKRFFDLCGWLCSYKSSALADIPTVVVLHGAEYARKDEASHMNQLTLKFLDWAVNYCERQQLPLILCLENAYSPRHFTTAEDLNSAQNLIHQLAGYPLGFCADLPHLAAYSGKSLSQLCLDSNPNSAQEQPSKSANFATPLADWLKAHLKHVHVHGYKNTPYVSHLPLSHSGAPQANPFASDFELLKSLNYSGLVIDEVLELPEHDAMTCFSKDLLLLNSW